MAFPIRNVIIASSEGISKQRPLGVLWHRPMEELTVKNSMPLGFTKGLEGKVEQNKWRSIMGCPLFLF